MKGASGDDNVAFRTYGAVSAVNVATIASVSNKYGASPYSSAVSLSRSSFSVMMRLSSFLLILPTFVMGRASTISSRSGSLKIVMFLSSLRNA